MAFSFPCPSLPVPFSCSPLPPLPVHLPDTQSTPKSLLYLLNSSLNLSPPLPGSSSLGQGLLSALLPGALRGWLEASKTTASHRRGRERPPPWRGQDRMTGSCLSSLCSWNDNSCHRSPGNKRLKRKTENDPIWSSSNQGSHQAGEGRWGRFQPLPSSSLPESLLLSVLHLDFTVTLNFYKIASGAGERAQPSGSTQNAGCSSREPESIPKTIQGLTTFCNFNLSRSSTLF